MKRLLVVLILVVILVVIPVLAQETTINKGTSVYIETTLPVSETTTKPVTTPEQTTIIDQIIHIIVPTTIQVSEPAINENKIKPIKDNVPKIYSSSVGKLSLVFTSPSPMKITNADNKNETIVSVIQDNNVELPVDFTKPGKIAVKIETGDMIYIIRRGE